MSVMGKALVVAGIVRTLYGRWQFQRLVLGAALLVGLTIVSSILAGAMLIGGFYAAYSALLHYGYDWQVAMMLTGLLVIGTTALFITVTVMRLRHIHHASIVSSVTTHADTVINAFFEGLMAED